MVGQATILVCDVDLQAFKLVVNEDVADRVRAVLSLIPERQVMIPVVVELNRRGRHNK